MDDVRFATVPRTLNGGAARRGMLTSFAALAGLHWSEAAAKRRRGRKKQARITPALAAQPASLVIETEKPGGPFIGTFEASGAFVDEGTFLVVESLITGAECERLLTTHITYVFTGAEGIFRLTT